MMTDRPRHVTIPAQCGETRRSSTRVVAANAMVLADRWAEQGCGEPQLIDPPGKALSRERFRFSLPLARKVSGRGPFG